MRLMMTIWNIVALRNEKGSYSELAAPTLAYVIVALRNEKGSYSLCYSSAGHL